MADWITCPGCQLRHSRRPDGLCPRCKQPVDAAVSGPTPDPGSTPAAAPIPDADAVSPSAARLGGLAQAARGKELRNARAIMLFVGGLTILANGYVFGAAEGNVQDEIDKEIRKLQPGFVVDPAKVEVVKAQAVRATRLVATGGLILGIVFCICGALVQKHPVPITITALA
ncbi:MAG TPA: hypothetical protein VKI41_17835, partial [Vicinamibacteria bacterium]|nr:hypothetical protein [Vicinamibacteria bacterium]